MSDIIRIVSAFLIWVALFSAVYGLHGIGCAATWSSATVAGTSLYRIVIVCAAALAILVQLSVLVALRQPRLQSQSTFVTHVSLKLAAGALGAQIWSLFPVAVLSGCD